jgi:hypothetical protein
MPSPYDAVARPLHRHLRRGLGYLLFERSSGIDTSGDVWLGTCGLNTPGRVGYVPSGWLTLRRALPPREVTPDDVFLDLGSGKGRIVDENPREVRIIYLNPHDENVDRLLATGRVELARRIRGRRPGREWSRSNSTHLYVLR